ncbi:hypothetical protein Vafri_18269 [Volvox africanus]|uniref:Uncharacterized protein n=1 Tax=Volvox africanus TaxID=51714 RepID=A0A8J4BLM7_9CHLO|nr:hypothetical protein Vafri_18269 [Volvox africanus]
MAAVPHLAVRRLLESKLDSSKAETTQHNWIVGFFLNGALISAMVAFFIAQLSKVFTHYYQEQVRYFVGDMHQRSYCLQLDGWGRMQVRRRKKTWDWTRLISSGGMPSSHTALIVALTTAIAVENGTSSSLFAVCLVIALIVMYDATGVRLHAGRQATVLNIIIAEMPPDHPVQDSGRLRDSLGHTPIQVRVKVEGCAAVSSRSPSGPEAIDQSGP